MSKEGISMRYQRCWMSSLMAFAGAFLLAGCTADVAPESNTLVIQGATILHGQNGARLENGTMVIQDERITSIAQGLPSSLPPDAKIIDGTGKWVVPGFVDVHAHDAGEAYLRAMLAWGVTSTHLMPNAPPASPVEMEQASQAATAPSPRLQVTTMFTGEFPDNLIPGVYEFRKPKSVSEAREAVQALHDNGYRQIKIIQDDSRLWTGPDNIAPRLDEAVFHALVAEAHARKMRVYVHATEKTDADLANAAGIEAFMHGTMDTLLDAASWEQMLAAGTAWTPTYHALYWFGDRRSYAQRILDDPRLTSFLPEDKHEEFKAQAQSETPIFFDAVQTLVNQNEAYVQTLAQNTRAARDAGVSIAVGSDGGPAGISTHLEMELLQENGLKASEVLAAATHGGALAMGRQEDIGSVEIGKLADLVVLYADPGIDIRNSRLIEWVIKGGKTYRPQDLVGNDPPRN